MRPMSVFCITRPTWMALVPALLFSLTFSFGAIAQPLFQNHYLAYHNERNAWSLATGDLNSDGRCDLVTNAGIGDVLDVYLARPDGTFEERVTYPLGVHPQWFGDGLVLADLDRDGKLDAITGGTAGFSFLRGNGDGSFVAPVVHATPGISDPEVVVADFDGDAWPDVALATADSGAVVIYPGIGGGDLGTPYAVPIPRDIYRLRAGDLDGDGRPDLVVSLYESTPVPLYRFSVLLNLGGGAFAPQAASTPTGPDVFLADIDLDGHLDVVADTIVYPGMGDGTFGTSFALEVAPVAFADFSGDGIPDVAGVEDEYYAAGVVSIQFGVGDGTYQASEEIGIPQICYAFGAGDFDGDGVEDIAAEQYQTGYTAVVHSNGDGSFGSGRNIESSVVPDRVALGDFDGDGRLDAMVGLPASGAAFFRGSGDGGLSQETSYALGFVKALAVGDFNLDGKPDVVAVVSGIGGRILLGNGDGTFVPQTPFSSGVSIAIGDVNGDHKPDLVTPSFWVPGNGDGTMGPAVGLPIGPVDAVALADMNGDGALDVLTCSSTGESVLLNDGSGTFTAGPTIPNPGIVFPHMIACADVNEDGRQDVVAQGNTTAGQVVVVLLGNGSGGLGAPTSAFGAGDDLVLADVDLDGHVDIVSAIRGTASAPILRGRGDGTFEGWRGYGGGFGASAQNPNSGKSGVGVGDLNGDGGPDLVLADGMAQLSVLLNLNPPNPTAVPRAPAPGSLVPRVSLRPNPVRGMLRADVVLPAAGNARIELIDLAGRVVRARSVSDVGAQTLELGSTGALAPGVYFVRVTQDGRSAMTRAVVLE